MDGASLSAFANAAGVVLSEELKVLAGRVKELEAENANQKMLIAQKDADKKTTFLGMLDDVGPGNALIITSGFGHGELVCRYLRHNSVRVEILPHGPDQRPMALHFVDIRAMRVLPARFDLVA